MDEVVWAEQHLPFLSWLKGWVQLPQVLAFGSFQMKYVLLQRQVSFLKPGPAWRTAGTAMPLSTSEVNIVFIYFSAFFAYCRPRINETKQKSRSSGRRDFHEVRQLLINWFTSVSSTASSYKPGLQQTHKHTHWTRQVDFLLANHQWHGAFCKSAWPRKTPAFHKNHLLQFCEEFFEDSKSKSSFPSGMVLEHTVKADTARCVRQNKYNCQGKDNLLIYQEF